ncbi:MAG: hypothetical protein KatS3mg108_2589 [Isosphaeraceae bacterium]|jgi:hypothetical protein|nr:MAG: hypothetical protein KatS3mg108_2589 [Isosphaeraceae bacterium]
MRRGLPQATLDADLRVAAKAASVPLVEAGGTIERARQFATQESPETTKLYDRTSDKITPVEIGHIAI